MANVYQTFQHAVQLHTYHEIISMVVLWSKYFAFPILKVKDSRLKEWNRSQNKEVKAGSEAYQPDSSAHSFSCKQYFL